MSSVWVQLHYEDERKGRPTSVKKQAIVEESDWNIDALIKATKTELKPRIDYAPVDEIFLFPTDYKPPFSQDKAIDPGDDVPTDTTSKNPLIVVAPQPQRDGENNFGCLLLNLFKPSFANTPSATLSLIQG